MIGRVRRVYDCSRGDQECRFRERRGPGQHTDEVLWYLADHQNSTRDVVRMVDTDTSSAYSWKGVREEHITYDSYGNVLQSIYDAHGDNSDTPVTLTGETGNDLRYLYTGQEFNARLATTTTTLASTIRKPQVLARRPHHLGRWFVEYYKLRGQRSGESDGSERLCWSTNYLNFSWSGTGLPTDLQNRFNKI